MLGFRPDARTPLPFFGGMAQLVERLHGMQEVRGSNPRVSTEGNAGIPARMQPKVRQHQE